MLNHVSKRGPSSPLNTVNYNTSRPTSLELCRLISLLRHQIDIKLVEPSILMRRSIFSKTYELVVPLRKEAGIPGPQALAVPEHN